MNVWFYTYLHLNVMPKVKLVIIVRECPGAIFNLPELCTWQKMSVK